jgi:hypothetical protein
MMPIKGALLTASSLLAFASALGVPPPPQPLEWGTIGDSWDSGVAYSDSVAYDNNKGNCLRLKDAYGAQMEADHTWTGAGGQTFHFEGCSGAQLVNMFASNGQIQGTGKPTFVVMTVGGNNAGFGALVDNCIYHGNPFGNYGPPWNDDPNGEGACKKSLASAANYIHHNGDGGLGSDFQKTLDDLFRSDQAKARSEFYLYVTGYAHFFNVDTDDCDEWSFSPWWVSQGPLVVKGLRVEMNNLLQDFLQVYVGFMHIQPFTRACLAVTNWIAIAKRD